MNTFNSLHQMAHRLQQRGSLGRKAAVAIRNLNQIVHGGFIGCAAQIDPSVKFIHNGLGVVIHETCVVGAGTCTFQQVTLGIKDVRSGSTSNRGGGAPTIGKNVTICAGAKILGDVTIGDWAVIGANAVVLSDVPANALAVGVPARIKASRGRATTAELNGRSRGDA